MPRTSSSRASRKIGAFCILCVGLTFGLTRCSLVVDTSGLANGAADAAAGTGDASDARLADTSAGDADGATGAEAASDAATTAEVYAAAVLADGPSMFLRLDEKNGFIASDETGSHAGTCVGAVERGVAGAFAGSLGVHFSGTRGGISIGDFFPFDGQKPYTLEVWVRPSAFDSAYRFVMGKDGANGGGRQEYAIYTYMDGIDYERYVAGISTSIVGGKTTTTEYHHVVVTYDGTLARMYLDGVGVGSETDTRSATGNAATFYIGSGAQPEAFPFDGDIDDVAVYEKALPAKRVTAHYRAARP